MPKIKTKRSARKRFKKRASDIKRKKAGRSHLLSGKTRKHKRRLRRIGIVSKSDFKRVKKLLPYN